jgi:hypothetical protein
MTLGTVRRTRCEVVAPLGEDWAVIETGYAVPRHTVILTLEQSNWTDAGKPDSGLASVTRSEKEDVIEHKTLTARIVGA